MPVETRSDSDASVTSLVSGILNDAQDLLKQQVNLFKHELREDIRKTKDASQVLGLGVGLMLLGTILLSFMLAHLLSWAVPDLPLWACFGICGGAMMAGGIIVYYVAMAKFGAFNPLPDQSAQALKENVQWITNPK